MQAAHPEVDYEGGVSAVLCNTAKGAAAIEALKSRVQWGGSSLEKVLPGNPSLVRSVTPYDVFDSIRFTGLSTESLGF